MTTTTNTFNVLHVATPALPRGARIGAELFARALGWIVTPPRSQPGGSTISRAREAAHVRKLADRVRDTDPGFAADLYAAAARHEELDG